MECESQDIVGDPCIPTSIPSERRSSPYQPRTIHLSERQDLRHPFINSSESDVRRVLGHTVGGARSGPHSVERSEEVGARTLFVEPASINSIAPDQLSLPSHEETERCLREYLQIPAPCPLDLSSAPEFKLPKGLPNLTHLILLAIWGSSLKRLTQSEICEAITERYPEVQSLQDQKWRASIRHRLSFKSVFVHVRKPRDTRNRGNHWIIDVSRGIESNRRDRSPHRYHEKQSEIGDDPGQDCSSDDDLTGEDELRRGSQCSFGLYSAHADKPGLDAVRYDYYSSGQNSRNYQPSYADHDAHLYGGRQTYLTSTSPSVSESVTGYLSAYTRYSGEEYASLYDLQIASTSHSVKSATAEDAEATAEGKVPVNRDTGMGY